MDRLDGYDSPMVPTELPDAALAEPIDGVGLGGATTLGELLGDRDDLSLLVFLRHYG